MPKRVAKMHDLDIFWLDKELDLRVAQAINCLQRSHGEWPDCDIGSTETSPHDRVSCRALFLVR